MTNYELFGGKCPYTGEQCGLTIECVDCSVDREEKESTAMLDKAESDVPDTNVGGMDCIKDSTTDSSTTNIGSTTGSTTDCISREAAISCVYEGLSYVEVENKLKALPDVNPAKWIPVSDRLPEYGVSVLTYDGICYFVEKRIPSIRDDNGESIFGEWWVSDDYDESNSEYYPNLRDGACIAWMPLPEPYKAESEVM